MNNIAVGTVLLVMLVIPGIVARSTFLFGPLSRKEIKSTAFDTVIWAIIPGIAIQLLGAAIVNSINLNGYFVDFESVGSIFSGLEIAKQFEQIKKNLWVLIGYNAVIIILSAFGGYALRKFIRYYQWDLKYRFLRFSNEWWYILLGEFALFHDDKKKKDRPKSKDKIETCEIYALVKSNQGQNYIYSGLIHSFNLNKEGALETIFVTGVARWEFNSGEETRRTYNIPSKIHVIKYCEVIDISIQVLLKSDAKFEFFDTIEDFVEKFENEGDVSIEEDFDGYALKYLQELNDMR